MLSGAPGRQARCSCWTATWRVYWSETGVVLSSSKTLAQRCARGAGALRLLDGDAGPHIIVAPASLLENWQRELALWCPSLRVAPYFGAARIDLRDELEEWRCGLLRAFAQMQGLRMQLVELEAAGNGICVSPTQTMLQVWYRDMRIGADSI